LPISLNDILAHHVTHDTTLTQNHLEPTQRPSSPFADIPSPPDTSKSTQPNQQPLYYSTRPIQPLARLKDYHVNHVFFLLYSTPHFTVCFLVHFLSNISNIYK